MKDRIEFEGVVLLGRTFDEYCQYFQLTDADLRRGGILDLGGGISSFCGEGCLRGYDITSADPIYGLPLEQIASKSAADLKNVLQQLPLVRHKYNWTYYKDPDDLGRHREAARQRFLKHYPQDPDRYVAASLPQTPFDDGQFSLVLVSHFLFLYDDVFDYEFHKKSLVEAIRISKNELRIYPLVNMRAEKSVFLEQIQQENDLPNLKFEIRKIDFEFFKNANELLIVRRTE